MIYEERVWIKYRTVADYLLLACPVLCKLRDRISLFIGTRWAYTIITIEIYDNSNIMRPINYLKL